MLHFISRARNLNAEIYTISLSVDRHSVILEPEAAILRNYWHTACVCNCVDAKSPDCHVDLIRVFASEWRCQIPSRASWTPWLIQQLNAEYRSERPAQKELTFWGWLVFTIAYDQIWNNYLSCLTLKGGILRFRYYLAICLYSATNMTYQINTSLPNQLICSVCIVCHTLGLTF